VLVALQRTGVLFDLQTDKDQRQDNADRADNLREAGKLFERHGTHPAQSWGQSKSSIETAIRRANDIITISGLTLYGLGSAGSPGTNGINFVAGGALHARRCRANRNQSRHSDQVLRPPALAS
jgi:hypothetical protein